MTSMKDDFNNICIVTAQLNPNGSDKVFGWTTNHHLIFSMQPYCDPTRRTIFCIFFFHTTLAKYDSSNEIQIPGYLVDLFSYGDSPRKDYRLGKDRVQNAL
jgi:hypothetical protein